jgi:lactoylglutathione lyase
MIRVGEPDRSIKFYKELLGYEVESEQKYESDRFTLIFLKLPGDESSLLELTHNWDTKSYDIGSGYGHMAYWVEDMDVFAKKVKDLGYSFSWGPDKTPNGKKSMAFLIDPDGYKVEIISS